MKNVRLYFFVGMLYFSISSCSSDASKVMATDGNVIGAYIAAFAALILGGLNLYQFHLSREDQKNNSRNSQEEQRNIETNRSLWEALKWFEGGTQKRSIGIAVVEAYWNDVNRKDIKVVWVPLLINQVAHILKSSDQKDKKTEEINLERMLELLKNDSINSVQKKQIRDIINESNCYGENGEIDQSKKGIYITEQQRDRWVEIFNLQNQSDTAYVFH